MHDEPDMTSPEAGVNADSLREQSMSDRPGGNMLRQTPVWIWLLPALAVAAGIIGFGLAGEREKAVVSVVAPVVLAATFLYMASLRDHISRQGRMGYLYVVAGGATFYLAAAFVSGSTRAVLGAGGVVLALFGAVTVVRAMSKPRG